MDIPLSSRLPTSTSLVTATSDELVVHATSVATTQAIFEMGNKREREKGLDDTLGDQSVSVSVLWPYSSFDDTSYVAAGHSVRVIHICRGLHMPEQQREHICCAAMVPNKHKH